VSAVIETIIICDINGHLCEGNYAEGDQRNFTAGEQRAGFKNELSRWHYHKGKDICYECWKESEVGK